MKDNYEFLVDLEEHVLNSMKAGTKVSDVYKKGIEFVKSKKPHLESALTKNFGFAMGIEFRESSLLIGEKTTAVLKKGMVFNVNLGFSGLSNKDGQDKESKTYALFIGDTVLINEVRHWFLSGL